MSSILHSLKTAARKHSAYHRMVADIESMSHRTAADVGINREDARQVAYRAVYGA